MIPKKGLRTSLSKRNGIERNLSLPSFSKQMIQPRSTQPMLFKFNPASLYSTKSSHSFTLGSSQTNHQNKIQNQLLFHPQIANHHKSFSTFSSNKRFKLEKKADTKQSLLKSLTSKELWHSWPIPESLSGMRLDRFLKQKMPDLPQSKLQKLIRERKIGILHFNNEKLNILGANYGLQMEDRVFISRPEYTQITGNQLRQDAKKSKEKEGVFIPDDKWKEVRSWVIYRDDDYIAINKPRDLACQGGSGQKEHLGTFLPALKFNAEEVPKLVHRLDKDTTGVLLLARNRPAAINFQKLLKTQSVDKTYHAICVGRPPQSSKHHATFYLKKGKISGQERMIYEETIPEDSDPKEWKHATVNFHTEDKPASPLASLIRLEPLTGRTHQLRVFCAKGLGAPILGDEKYGMRSSGTKRIEQIAGKGTLPLCLHASSISFLHPGKKSRKKMTLSAPFPQHMKDVLAPLKGMPRLQNGK